MTEPAPGFLERALFEAPAGCLLHSTGDGEHVIVVDHLGIGAATRVWDDGMFVAELDSANEPKRVYWDGDPGPELDAVVPLPPDGSHVRFSSDLRHVAYLAATEGRSRARVGVDGTLGPEFAGVSEDVFPTLSPTGGRIAYGALVEGVVRMVIDHDPLLDFFPAPSPPLFDERGLRLAFVAVSPSGAPPERVVVDGVGGREYDGIVGWGLGTRATGEPEMLSSLAFGPDGALGYVALEGSSMLVVLDGVEGPRFDEIHPLLAFSPEGGHVAYPVRDGQRMTCVVDGVAQGAYDTVGRPAFGPDGRLMYAVEHGGKFALVVDGKEQGEHSGPTVAYRFSPDGAHHAYLTSVRRALRGERRCCVADGTQGPEFDAIESPPVFSPGGDHLAYVARRGRECFAVVDGSPERTVEWAYFPAFSASGRFAYVAGDSDGSLAVVVDGLEGPAFETLTSVPGMAEPPWFEYVEPRYFAFSPDGAHIAYTGAKRGLGARPVVDDALGPAYEVATFPAVDDRRATFYGWRDGIVHHVTYEF